MKQHRKPCGTCPFTTKCEPGATGGSPAETYVAQTLLPYWVPCHEFIDYDNPNWKDDIQKDLSETPQCVGHAILRARIGVASRMPKPLIQASTLCDTNYDWDNVFESLAHFYAHHCEITVDQANEILNENLEQILLGEFCKSSAKFHAV